MAKKQSLPVLDKPPAKKPSLASARARLGGHPEKAEPPFGLAPGRIVTFALPSGRRRAAVVVYAGADEVHVLLDSMRVRRFPPDEVAPLEGAASDELTKLAADAHVFGLLAEGRAIRYADEGGGLVDGKLIEKCRWGALVAREDGTVVAVGFRKLWPAPDAAFGSS